MTHVLNTKHGRMMIVNGRDLISQSLFATGSFEWHIVQLASALLADHEDGSFVDVGANIGTFSMPLLADRPRLVCHAFEMQPSIYRQLIANSVLNGVDDRLIARQAALGDAGRELFVAIPNSRECENSGGVSIDESHNAHFGTAGDPVAISVRPLDSFGICDARLIKIDTEGYELEVIAGARETIERCGFPPIIYESWTGFRWHDEKASRVEGLLREIGYTTHAVGQDRFAVHADGATKVAVSYVGDEVRVSARNVLHP